MSTKYVYVCDHCGATCTDKFKFSLFGKWARKDAQFIPDNVHGCTRDHTILAVAKILGIGVDGKATGLLAEKDARIAELERACIAKDARTHEEMLVRQSAQQDAAALREHIAALEARLDAAEVLQRVRDRIDSNYEGKTCDSILGYLDHEIANLTGPKKPTKPAGEWHSENNIGEPTGFHTGMDD